MNGDNWYFAKDNEQQGPVALDTLKQMLASSQLPASTLVWNPQLSDWTEASELAIFGPAPVAPPAVPVPGEPALNIASPPAPNQASLPDPANFAREQAQSSEFEAPREQAARAEEKRSLLDSINAYMPNSVLKPSARDMTAPFGAIEPESTFIGFDLGVLPETTLARDTAPEPAGEPQAAVQTTDLSELISDLNSIPAPQPARATQLNLADSGRLRSSWLSNPADSGRLRGTWVSNLADSGHFRVADPLLPQNKKLNLESSGSLNFQTIEPTAKAAKMSTNTLLPLAYKRCAARAIDMTLFFIPCLLIYVNIIGRLLLMTQISAYPPALATAKLAVVCLCVLISFALEVLLLTACRTTVGKTCMSLQIRDLATSAPLTGNKALVRTAWLYLYLSFIAIWIPFAGVIAIVCCVCFQFHRFINTGATSYDAHSGAAVSATPEKAT